MAVNPATLSLRRRQMLDYYDASIPPEMFAAALAEGGDAGPMAATAAPAKAKRGKSKTTDAAPTADVTDTPTEPEVEEPEPETGNGDSDGGTDETSPEGEPTEPDA